jgi:hypothetical protein
LTFIPFTEEDVEGVTSNLKDRTAAGPDDLYTEELKNSEVQLLSIQTELLKKCMELGTIHKNGDILWPKSYTRKGRFELH